jgi:hypothetical protein
MEDDGDYDDIPDEDLMLAFDQTQEQPVTLSRQLPRTTSRTTVPTQPFRARGAASIQAVARISVSLFMFLGASCVFIIDWKP